MGIVNASPESFSDGGRWATLDAQVERAHELVAEGADLI
ncbi:MAG: dihydropteroate synthase, partial [Thermoleophilaceae bacterium]